MNSRRSFLQRALAFGAGAISFNKLAGAESLSRKSKSHSTASLESESAHIAAVPVSVVTPDIPKLPYTMDGEVKVFHLVAEPVKRELLPGRVIDAWGYNGTCPGPTIEAAQGDRVRIVLENRLPEPTTMHWHGLEIPNAMDGMPYISQKPILPGERFAYEFTLHQNGTFFYHSHGAMQEMMGMMGIFVLHPQRAFAPQVDHDFGIVLQEWALLPNNSIPNTAGMEFNWLTFNGKAGPATTPIVVPWNSRVRIRFVNLGMDHHPIHLHGHTFQVTGTEGGRKPPTTWDPGNTVLVGVAQARDIEFVADNPGDWMIHCHLPHHMMNSMMDLLRDRQITTAAQTDPQALSQMMTLANTVGFEHVHHSPIADDAESVKGFPQDAFMEMGMDSVVAKPETHGLPANWSAEMMGMMTLVRVLPDDQYNEIVRLRQQQKSSTPKNPAVSEEHHEHN
jgi:FtsP/CotA-like multicopper oxidase with cupredoxin domain